MRSPTGLQTGHKQRLQFEVTLQLGSWNYVCFLVRTREEVEMVVLNDVWGDRQQPPSAPTQEIRRNSGSEAPSGGTAVTSGHPTTRTPTVQHGQLPCREAEGVRQF